MRELQHLVKAFHERGHRGHPRRRLQPRGRAGAPHGRSTGSITSSRTPAGNLANWSGCGNDLRASAAMAKRLIIDSCIHLIEAYGVDGFRFDLAELIGVEVLREIEAALKRVKPSVILIAEPWSFRGHIAGALRDTGWASWNDGFRNFVRDYVARRRRRRSASSTSSGARPGTSPSGRRRPSTTPSRTTTAPGSTRSPRTRASTGRRPTPNDVRRTHLMASILFMSVGHPDDRRRARISSARRGAWATPTSGAT